MTLTNISKPTTTFANSSKPSTSLGNSTKIQPTSLWSSGVFPWQLALPWQYGTTDITNNSKPS